jgi:hypothetical protein
MSGESGSVALDVVVDASIAATAGGSSIAPHPSSTCHQILRALRAPRQGPAPTFVFGAKLQREWRTHASGYAKDWLVEMIQDKRASLDVPETLPEPIEREVAGAERTLADCLLHKSVTSRHKDAHLIALAARSTGRIITGDAGAAKLARDAARATVGLSHLMVAVPEDDDPVVDWVHEGMPTNPRFVARERS